MYVFFLISVNNFEDLIKYDDDENMLTNRVKRYVFIVFRFEIFINVMIFTQN